ncbi:MAG TPA: hypothetical protein VIL44_12330 [Micromonospora sp.]
MAPTHPAETLRRTMSDRVAAVVADELTRLRRRRPELAAAALHDIEETLWRIADRLLLTPLRQLHSPSHFEHVRQLFDLP